MVSSWVARYRQFVSGNAEIIGNIESSLRSLSYIIPVFALLNLFRLYNDSILVKDVFSGPSRPTSWNRYLEFLKSQSPLARILVTWLNVLRIIEVPTELIIGKLLSACARSRFIILVELQKYRDVHLTLFAIFRLLMKTFLWVLSGFRKTTTTLMPSSVRSTGSIMSSRNASLSQIDMISKSLEQEHADPLNDFVKHSRIDPFVLMPELAMPQCTSLLDKLRELAHLTRPLLYASLYVYGRNPSVKWSGWSLALSMELFASWPQIISILAKTNPASGTYLSEEEDRNRLVRLLFFILREPFYSVVSKDRLNALKESLGEWRLLRPLVHTADTYQKLCEAIYFYTASS